MTRVKRSLLQLDLLLPYLVVTAFAANGMDAKVHISLGGTIYNTNNSYIKLADVGEGPSESITCHTDLPTCCRARDTGDVGVGEWYSPNGTVIPSAMIADRTRDPFYRSRNAPGALRLNLVVYSYSPIDRESLAGSYCCEIPTSVGGQKFCVNLGANCESLPPINNGFITTNTSIVKNGTVVTYSCREGHYLVGSTSRTCQDDFTWSGDPTYCLKGCQDLSFANGKTVYSKELSSSVRPVGTVAQTSCDTDHYLNTDGNRTCVYGGTWSGNDTVCTPGIFQFRLNRVYPSCDVWVSTNNSIDKYNDIMGELSQGVNTLCQDCGFTTLNIVDGFMRCFSQDHVTIRGVLTGTRLMTVAQLLSHVEDWVQSTPSVTVLHVSLGVNSSCPTVIESLDQPGCHITSSSATTTEVQEETVTCHHQRENIDCINYIVGVGILGLLWIVTLIILVVVSIALGITRKQLKHTREHTFSVNPSYGHQDPTYAPNGHPESTYYEDVSHLREDPAYMSVPICTKQQKESNIVLSNVPGYDTPTPVHSVLTTSPSDASGTAQMSRPSYMNLPRVQFYSRGPPIPSHTESTLTNSSTNGKIH